jgi:4a-hydroxytetrahydrobiopterin dehydratase
MAERTLSREKLSPEEREAALRELEGWSASPSGREAIQKTFRFKDFNQAWYFMSLVARKAEEMDHHPEWFNVYNRVEVTLATHTCQSVSQLDIALAKAMNEFAREAAQSTQKILNH